MEIANYLLMSFLTLADGSEDFKVDIKRRRDWKFLLNIDIAAHFAFKEAENL